MRDEEWDRLWREAERRNQLKKTLLVWLFGIVICGAFACAVVSGWAA